MYLSSSVSKIKPSATLKISAKAADLKAAGHDIISLSIGEPDYSTPKIAQEAGINAIQNCQDNYPPNSGTKELKLQIKKKLKNDNNLDYNEEEIVVSNGVKQILFQAFFSLVDPGDEVLLPKPYWVSYKDMVEVNSGVVVTVENTSDFRIDIKDLASKISAKTKVLVLNSPNNPSGACYTRDDLRDIADILLKNPGIVIISDDIYEHIIYDDQKFYNILQIEPKLRERTLVVNGVSKCYAMTGWRIGYGAIYNKQIRKAISDLQTQITGGACSIAQAAATAALTCDKSLLEERNKSFKSRRDLALSILMKANGIKCFKPSGAFYLFISCKDILGKKSKKGNLIRSDVDFASYLLEEFLVSVVPGSAFGMPGYFRISYALSQEKLEIACKRVLDACSELV